MLYTVIKVSKKISIKEGAIMRKVKNLAVVVTAAAILTVLGGCTSQNSLETTGGQSPRETAVEEMAEASDTSEAFPSMCGSGKK